jgi:hypothetical protein
VLLFSHMKGIWILHDINLIINLLYLIIHKWLSTTIVKRCWVLVTHTCNTRDWGGRDQEDHGWKPSWANNSRDPISKKPITHTHTHTHTHTKSWWSASRCRPWVQAPVLQKKKKKMISTMLHLLLSLNFDVVEYLLNYFLIIRQNICIIPKSNE